MASWDWTIVKNLAFVIHLPIYTSIRFLAGQEERRKGLFQSRAVTSFKPLGGTNPI